MAYYLHEILQHLSDGSEMLGLVSAIGEVDSDYQPLPCLATDKSTSKELMNVREPSARARTSYLNMPVTDMTVDRVIGLSGMANVKMAAPGHSYHSVGPSIIDVARGRRPVESLSDKCLRQNYMIILCLIHGVKVESIVKGFETIAQQLLTLADLKPLGELRELFESELSKRFAKFKTYKKNPLVPHFLNLAVYMGKLYAKYT